MERCSSNRCGMNNARMGNNRQCSNGRQCPANRMNDSMNRDNSCGCRRDNNSYTQNSDNNMSRRCGDMEGFALAMAYVPWQMWNEIYPLNTGLQRGTIFPELDKPFFRGRCR